MIIRHFFDETTATLTYVVHDEQTRDGVVIDSVTSYDPRNGRTYDAPCRHVAAYVDRERLRIHHVLDTHAHADHWTGMPYFRERYRARTVIGRNITRVQRIFSELFHLGPGFPTDGRQFDVLLDDGEELESGSLRIRALHTPGHTPACLTYAIGDVIFVGDVLFMPDYGTARCDFPGGSAADLYDSVRRIYALPGETRLFTGHDYQPRGRPLRFETTVAEERETNVQLRAGTTREEFVAFRTKRDAGLELPKLLVPAIQVNIRAGSLPEPESNGVSYLKMPLNAL